MKDLRGWISKKELAIFQYLRERGKVWVAWIQIGGGRISLACLEERELKWMEI